MHELAPILSPAGPLRAVVNLGNAVLAAPGGSGVALDLLGRLAAALGVPMQVTTVAAAPQAVAALAEGRADASVLAIDAARPLDYGPALLAIEGGYAVPEGSPLRSMAEVDRPATRVVVGAGSAYDLHLARRLRAATILRVPSSAAVVPAVLAGAGDVAAGLRPALGQAADLRLLPGAFMAIRQSLAVPQGRGPALAAMIAAVRPEVAAALARHRAAAVPVPVPVPETETPDADSGTGI